MSFGNCCCNQGCVTTSRGYYRGDRNGLAAFADLLVAKYKVKCPATLTGITAANKTSYPWPDDFSARDFLAGDIVMVRVVTPRVCETTTPTFESQSSPMTNYNVPVGLRVTGWSLVYPDARDFTTADWNDVELVTCRFFKAAINTSQKPFVKYGVAAYAGETIHADWTEVAFPFTAASALSPSLTTVDKVNGFGYSLATNPIYTTPVTYGLNSPMTAEVTFITDSAGTPRTGHFVANAPNDGLKPLQTPVTQIKPGMRCVSGANTFYALIAMDLVTTPGGISSASPVGGYQINPDSCIGMNYTGATKPAWRLVSIAGTYAFGFEKPPYAAGATLTLKTSPAIQLDTHNLAYTRFDYSRSTPYGHPYEWELASAEYPVGNSSKPDFTDNPTTEWKFNLNTSGNARYTGAGQALYSWLQATGTGPFAASSTPRAMLNFWEALGGTGVGLTETIYDIEIGASEMKFSRQVSAIAFNILGRAGSPSYREDLVYYNPYEHGPLNSYLLKSPASYPLVSFGDIPLRAFIALIEVSATQSDLMTLEEFIATIPHQDGEIGSAWDSYYQNQGEFRHAWQLRKVTVPNIEVCLHRVGGNIWHNESSDCQSFVGPGEVLIPEDANFVNCNHRVVIGYNPLLSGSDKNVYMEFPGCICAP